MTHPQDAMAAKMAGEWWAARLNEKYSDRKEALAAAIEARVAGELGRGGRSYVECDYEPLGLLAEAVGEVFKGMPANKLFTSLQDLFPRKHALMVKRDVLEPKEGYARWTDAIQVPAPATETEAPK